MFVWLGICYNFHLCICVENFPIKWGLVVWTLFCFCYFQSDLVQDWSFILPHWEKNPEVKIQRVKFCNNSIMDIKRILSFFSAKCRWILPGTYPWNSGRDKMKKEEAAWERRTFRIYTTCQLHFLQNDGCKFDIPSKRSNLSLAFPTLASHTSA